MSTSLHPTKALKHPLHELLVVEPGDPRRSFFRIPSLMGYLRELGFDPGMGAIRHCSTHLPSGPSPDTYRAALYLEPSQPSEATEDPVIPKEILAQDIPVLPRVPDVRRASAVPPPDLAHLNVLEWPKASLPARTTPPHPSRATSAAPATTPTSRPASSRTSHGICRS